MSPRRRSVGTLRSSEEIQDSRPWRTYLLEGDWTG